MTLTTHKDSLIGKILKFGVPMCITVGLCWLMFKNIDYRDMLDTVRNECNFAWIAFAMALSVLSHVFRALRWNIQLRAIGVRAPLFYVVLSIFGTYAVNLVFPRLGELWRSGYIAQRQKAPFSSVFGSMLADRLSDTITVICIIVVVFMLASSQLVKYFSQNVESYHRLLDIAMSPILWVGVLAVVGLIWWTLARPAKEGTFRARVQGFVKGLWTGFAAIATMKGKGMWLFLTFCLWGCYFLQLYVAFFAFPFTREVVTGEGGFVAALVAFVFSSVAMGVPSNGGIGPWQWAMAFALGLYGVGQVEGLAFANLVIGTSTLVLICLGIFTFICIMVDRRKSKEDGELESVASGPLAKR